jgi:hypothetical protein|tara:strand:+ start:568 stop:873 length:306 start_codon:yes stop_codon:yes gene_type:complete
MSNYKDEVSRVLNGIIAEGLTLVGLDDGETVDVTKFTTEDYIEGILAVGDAHLYLKRHKDDNDTAVYFVLGNEPGVAVNDFAGKESVAVDKVTSEVYDHFN